MSGDYRGPCPVSVSVVMPSGHTHTLSHVSDFDADQQWDCGTVHVTVKGHLVTVKPLPTHDAAPLIEAYEGLEEAVRAYLDPENQYTHSRLRSVERALETLTNLRAIAEPPPPSWPPSGAR